ncbi:hypothetical protein AYK24_00625 [Thermoplasmatales archaeon SG8-52-4]|nr:MAG: hypothetical protein AYK24_00625 [Thermoplasmatales archaeon SG8-52-4]
MSSYLPEINVQVPCDPSDLISKLEEDLERELGEFSNTLKNSRIWGNPLITAGISQVLGTAASFFSTNLVENLLESDVVSEIIERAQDYVSVFLTSEPQMKLAANYLLIQNLKSDLKARVEVLDLLEKKLTAMDRFIRAWDYYEIANFELRKLRQAEAYMRGAKSKMKRSSELFKTFQRFASNPYRSAVQDVKSAGDSLEIRYVDPNRPDLFVYWKKWWDKVQDDLKEFAENSLDVLSLLPADKKILDDVFPEWVSIYGLLSIRFVQEATNSGKSSTWLQDFAKREINRIFKGKELIPLNKTIRKTLLEISNLDSTWEGMNQFAGNLSTQLEENLNNITTLQEQMERDAYLNIPSEVKLAAKNAMYLTQLRALYTQLLINKEIVTEYDDLLSDFVALETLITEARRYPEEGTHPAETVADLVLESYEAIIFGFFSEGGSRQALIKIGNVKRRINIALQNDQYLVGLCNAFDALDNALVSEILRIYNKNIGYIENLFEQIGNTAALNAVIELDFSGLKDKLWPKRSDDRCVGKQVLGDLAESRAEMDLRQNQRKLNWTKALIEKMDWIQDPLAAIKSNFGLSMLGE